MNLKKTQIFALLTSFAIQGCISQVKTTHAELDKVQRKNRPTTQASIPFSDKPGTKQGQSDIQPLSQNSGVSNDNGSESQTVDQIIAQSDLDNMQKLERLINISINSKNINEQELARNQSIAIVNYKLTTPELQNLTGMSSYGFLRGYALYRLAENAIENKDTNLAKNYLNNVIEFMPGSTLDFRAREVLKQMEVLQSVRPRTIGAVLPLSGKNAPMGQRALRGIELGLGLNLPNSSFKLAVVDSEGVQDVARLGVEKLVKEDGAIAIIGSLLSKTAPAVASKADEYGVPSIALSQKTGITEVGPTVFRNSLTAKMQIKFLVTNAIQKLKMSRFAILYPNDPYGIEYANIFWDEVLAQGGTIAAAQTYNTNDTDFRFQTQKLVGTYYVEGRMDEFKLRQKELLKTSNTHPTKKKLREHSGEDVLPPVVDFDAIFIPDDVRNMGQIAAFLAYTGVKNVKLLGTNLWNTPSIAKRAGNFNNSLVFVDSLSANADAKSNSNAFINEYRAIFGESPGLIEIQAYDSALILKQLILEGANQRESLSQSLGALKQIQGALGPLTLNEDREFVRPLTLLTLDKGEIVPLLNFSTN